jgi:hypothetical protein
MCKRGDTRRPGVGAGIIRPAARTLGHHMTWETGGNLKDGASYERRQDQLGKRGRGGPHPPPPPAQTPQPSHQRRKSKGENGGQGMSNPGKG